MWSETWQKRQNKSRMYAFLSMCSPIVFPYAWLLSPPLLLLPTMGSRTSASSSSSSFSLPLDLSLRQGKGEGRGEKRERKQHERGSYSFDIGMRLRRRRRWSHFFIFFPRILSREEGDAIWEREDGGKRKRAIKCGQKGGQ